MGGLLSKRWEMAMLIMSGIALVYTLRVNMSVASVKMKDDLSWTEEQKGYILSSFYWGYTIGQVPASIYAQWYGAKWLFGLSVAIPSFLTIMVPMACRYSFGTALFVRVLIGFFESATFPCAYHFFTIWVPAAEKTIMIPAILCGVYVGEIIGFSLSGALADSKIYINGEFYGGWPSIFYVFGLAGIAWFPLWVYAAHESPAVHPTITQEEVLFINKGKDTSYGNTRHSSNERESSMRPLLQEPDTFDSDNGTSLDLEADGMDNHVSMTGTLTARTRSASSSHKQTQGSSGGSSSNKNLTLNMPLHDFLDDYSRTEFEPKTVTSPLVHRTSANTLNANNYHSTSSVTSSSVPMVTRQAGGSGKDKSELLVHAEHSHERRYTKAELNARTPWTVFFTHPVALAMLTCSFGFGWIGFTLLSEMPSYLTDILGFDLGSAGILCVFPYLALFFSTLTFARIFDYLQREHDWKVARVRRTAMIIAFVGSATGLVICGFLDEKYAAYMFMVLSQVLFGAAQAGIGCIWTDVTPLYSSQLNAIGNTVSAIAGVAGPIVVSALITAWPGVWGWRAAFLLTFLMSGCFTVLWVYVIKAEVVPALNTPATLSVDIVS